MAPTDNQSLSVYDSIKAAVTALGGYKKVGYLLWPDKTMRVAGQRLSDCLNEEKADKLSLEEIEFIAEEAARVGCFTIASRFAAISGGAYIEPNTSEEARLQAELKDIEARQLSIKGRLRELKDK